MNTIKEMFEKARKSPAYWQEMAELERGEREILERENARLVSLLKKVEFLAYQPAEVREAINVLSNTKRSNP